VVANLAGRAAVGLSMLAAVPVYLRYLGAEAYGLASLALTFRAIATSLDQGLTTTMNRELARSDAQARPAGETRDLARTLELAYWAFAALVGIVCMATAPFVADRWLNPGRLDAGTVREALVLIGVLLALELPLNAYAGGLQGLRRQVALNVLTSIAAVVRFAGAAMVVAFFSPTVRAFLSWQCLAAFGTTVAAGRLLWSRLPSSGAAPRFRWRALREVRHFALGVAVVAISGVFIQHVDKLVLMRLAPLESLGHYTVAATLAGIVYQVVGPIHAAAFPRLAASVAARDEADLRRQYHRACQLMAMAVMPLAAVLSCYPEQVLGVWISDRAVVAAARGVLPIMAVTAAINAVLTVPYALQLAHGYLRLSLVASLAASLMLPPLVAALTVRHGLTGAAAGYAIYNAVILLIGPPLVHRRFLVGDLRRWSQDDVVMPAAAAFGAAGAGLLVLRWPVDRMAVLPGLLACGALSTLAAAVATPLGREWIMAARRR
jgi:O-antigen/teichoic acid export membrane protein